VKDHNGGESLELLSAAYLVVGDLNVPIAIQIYHRIIASRNVEDRGVTSEVCVGAVEVAGTVKTACFLLGIDKVVETGEANLGVADLHADRRVAFAEDEGLYSDGAVGDLNGAVLIPSHLNYGIIWLQTL